MIAYDPREWIRPVFQFHRSDTFRKLFLLILLIGLITAGVAWIENQYLRMSQDSRIKNIILMHQLLGFAISMLLVFRTNTAYDRWWEGRKLWGALVNVSRNLSVKVAAWLRPEDAEDRAHFARLVSTFATELRNHLLREKTRLALDDQPHPELALLDRERHVPAQVVLLLHQRTDQLVREGRITQEQLIVLSNDINAFLDICGACERIKNTPIPWSYTTFIKKFIVIYTITLPLGFALSMGWLAIPIVMFMFYVLASLELIAEEIEDPFGRDTNDLPMQKLAENIGNDVREILR
jgi:ion channel-forming bestrophin family protein